MDRITDITWAGPSGTLHSLSYQYDAAGMITNRLEESASGTRHSIFAYDSLDRLTGEAYSDGAGTVYDEATYGYDLAGNRTNKTHNGVTVSFDLGAGNRMTNWNAVVSTNAEALLNVAGYSTEDIGTHPLYGEWTVNDEDAQVWGTNFWATTVFADLSQSTQSVVAAMGDEAGNVGRDTNAWTLTVITNAAYDYDDAGNVTEIAYNTSNTVLTLDWDSQYQLLSVSTGTNEVESYTYDPFGRRLTTSVGTNTIIHVYDGIHCVADVDEAGDLVRSYTYGPEIDNPLAMTTYSATETNTYYYLTDHLGSVLALTDGDGYVVERYEYDAWGRVVVFDGNNEAIAESAYGNRITFQGREYSWATGLYYFRARWYDPITWRWLSKDPIGISGGLNQYEAFASNPVMFVDPDGLLFGIRANDAHQMWMDIGVMGQDRGGVAGNLQTAGASLMMAFIDFWGTRTLENNAKKSGYYSAIDGCEVEALLYGGLAVGQIGLEAITHAGAMRAARLSRAAAGRGVAGDISKSRHNIDLGNGRQMDLKGRHPNSSGHFNKTTQTQHGYPHVHDPRSPGGVRPPRESDWEYIYRAFR